MDARVFQNCRIASQSPQGLIGNGALVAENGRIRWLGAAVDLPDEFRALPTRDLDGRLMTPALIDCHTHLIHAGSRAAEFLLRQQGVSYAEIARQGGGIMATVTATRAEDVESLVAAALPRLDALIGDGVALIEVKSGYGLSIPAEIAMLRAARRLAELRPVRITTTWLAAHAVPPEYAGRPDAYISEVAIAGLHAAHARGLVDAVDGFCENIAFSPAQIARLFDAATALGLPVKLHAEQLSNQGASALAASYGALSADHLEYLDDRGIAEMAASGTVATLLPGAFYTLGETRRPPITALRAAGVPIAIATDANPGSAPLYSLLLAMNMAATLFHLTPDEALLGVTRNAALALGQAADCGTLEVGKRADLAVWDVAEVAELVYRMGANPLFQRIIGGRE